ncbi:MAG: aspartate aminotransferase family protein [Clostridia bacterium]|nr:aspartate aminotransferase family protein [Clostridia bacterium]
MKSFKQLDENYVAHTYKRFPVEIVRGQGSLLYDVDGKEYIDMGSGIAVSSLGVSDAGWVAAVTAQLGQVQHTSNLYYTSPCAELAAELCKRTGLKKVFFGNSGAEANECAIKVARKYAADKKGEGAYQIVTLENSFHGRTLATLSATGQAHYHELFQPLVDGFLHTPANDFEAFVKLAEENKIAAIMMEAVQGEGGVYALDRDFVTRVAAFAKENDILVIFDEVQTGNGRTGELYAYMHYGVTPDVVTTAKGLGGGLPIGACMLGEKVEGVLGYGDHGSTFGGNPVCAAGALYVLSQLDDNMLADVRKKSAYVFESLCGAKGVKSVSGMGLMIGIETEKPAADIVAACREQGVLCLTAKHKVRLLPALNIPQNVLEKAIEIIKSACAE